MRRRDGAGTTVVAGDADRRGPWVALHQEPWPRPLPADHGNEVRVLLRTPEWNVGLLALMNDVAIGFAGAAS